MFLEMCSHSDAVAPTSSRERKNVWTLLSALHEAKEDVSLTNAEKAGGSGVSWDSVDNVPDSRLKRTESEKENTEPVTETENQSRENRQERPKPKSSNTEVSQAECSGANDRGGPRER